MRRLSMLALLALVAACDQPAPRKADQAAGPPAANAPPAVPAWAAGLQGQPFTGAFPNAMQCTGYVDGPAERTPASILVLGWSWVEAAKAGASNVVMVDASGNMVAFGNGGGARPDVPANVKTITRPDVGWSIRLAPMTGVYTVYGVDPAAKSACRLGEARL